MTELEARIRDWLTVREPVATPERLRTSIAEVPYHTRLRPFGAMAEAWAGWPPGLAHAGRAAAMLIVLTLLLAMVAVISVLTSRPEPGPMSQNGLVVFSGGPRSDTLSRQLSLDIYLVNADGDGLRQLTQTDLPELSPTFSPDGSRLAYLSGERMCQACAPGGVRMQLHVADVTSGERLFAADVPLGYASNAEWAPDGRSILVHSGGSAWSVDVDTGAWEQLTRGNHWQASWSPDGRWLLVVRDGLYAVPAAEVGDAPILDPSRVAGARQLTDGAVSWPKWSPDSASVLFSSYTGGEQTGGVAVVALGGGLPMVLADDGFAPAWSPDGTRVAYLRIPDEGLNDPESRSCRTTDETGTGGDGCEGAEVWVMDADGGNPRHVANSFTPPKWSPDSSLVHVFRTDGLASIDTADPDRRVQFMPEEFWPGAAEIAWLSQRYQWGEEQGHADWQAAP